MTATNPLWRLRRVGAALLLGTLLAGTLPIVTGCAPMEPASKLDRHDSHALATPEATRIGRAIAADAPAHPGLSAFRLLDDGMEAFLLRIAMCEMADRTLDVQYYIYHDDNTGRLFTDALLRAADRGVRVRVLIDDLNLPPGSDLIQLDAHANIEVRSYNPFTWRSSMTTRLASGLKEGYRLNRRMHNKSFIVDNALAVIGGRNIADEYFDASPHRDFNDIDLAAAGPTAQAISASFDAYWNSDHAYPIEHLGLHASPTALEELRATLTAHVKAMADSDYARALRETRLAQQLVDRTLDFIWATAEFTVDNPDKVVEGLDRESAHPMSVIFRHARRAQREFMIMSPYFIPGEEGVALFRELRERGVAVRILTNSMEATDVAAVFGGYSPYRKQLLDLGVELYELKPMGGAPPPGKAVLFSSSLASLHSKAFIVDREIVTVASLNMDPRSVNLNTELAVVVDSAALAARVVKRFEHAALPENSYRLRYADDSRDIVWVGREESWTHDPGVSAWRRFVVRILSWLPIEGQL